MGSTSAFHLRRLLSRATFGARPGELEKLLAEGLAPSAWLSAQFARAEQPDPELDRRLRVFPDLAFDPAARFEESRDMAPDASLRASESARKRLRDAAKRITRQLAGARIVRAVHGRAALREVMIDFWSNHFSVFARKGPVGALLPHYQRDVLEVHALGRFEDLLVDVARSPAMLVYLDNWNSTVPRPPGPSRRRRREPRGRGGINENYARELLELHTLGVNGGYTQDDVREVARVFTGWSLVGRHDPRFAFHERHHDTGPKRVLGERVRGRGVEEGRNLLARLSHQPATAHHIASGLAQRFVADDPPRALVERVAKRFLASGGEIRAVLRELLLSPEFADPAHRKLKTPLRFAVSALRETGGETDGGAPFLMALSRLGEVPFFARTPAGFPEEAGHWIDPGATLERMKLAFALSRGEIRGTRLGASLPKTAASLSARSLARDERVAVALASPEFQWTI